MPILSYEGGSLLNSFRVSNYLLEHYIEDELIALFKSRHIVQP